MCCFSGHRARDPDGEPGRRVPLQEGAEDEAGSTRHHVRGRQNGHLPMRKSRQCEYTNKVVKFPADGADDVRS